ncbi:MAG: glycosyltransferase [Bacteroidetes bacterium]|nr:glycosyltransferase [Bacteroidota bacterium]
MKKKIIFLYPYYWPHYQAGGPVQSLYNLTGILKDEVDLFFLSKATDCDGSPIKDLPINKWVEGSQGEHILYKKHITPASIFKLLKNEKPDAVFINGIFNASTTLPGIFFARLLGIKIFFSPRGMLQAWGLARRKQAKRLYLLLIRWMLPKSAEWHATDEKEAQDIGKIFGTQRAIHIASNVPRKVAPYQPLSWVSRNEKIKLVFLSLINPNKNLHELIDAVTSFSDTFTLNIWGPVADETYWQTCLGKMNRAKNITYQGAVPPWQVQELLGQYHFFVLPTQGENFGHAIFDALSSSVPVIISKNTPWAAVEEKGAGFYLNIGDQLPDQLKQLFHRVQELTDSEYDQFRKSAHVYAAQYEDSTDFLNQYRFMLEQ